MKTEQQVKEKLKELKNRIEVFRDNDNGYQATRLSNQVDILDWVLE